MRYHRRKTLRCR